MFTRHFYLSSQEAWDGMYEACESARRSINFEQFIFENDAVGRRFIELFLRKAKEGVRVRLLCDMAGSLSFFLSTQPSKLRSGGVEVVFFNPVSPWRVTRFAIWLFRDHRKLLVVDDEVAFVGGVGLGEDMANWRDTHMRLSGPIARELLKSFDQMWAIAHDERRIRIKEPRQTEDGYLIVTNTPRRRQRFINRMVLEVIRNADKYLYITTPYFVPDTHFFRVLCLAAKRGVDVRILLPKNSDHPYVDFASNFYFRKAFKYGVKIYGYVPSMLHAKTMVIDDDWSSVGSSNIDNFSSFFNHELNVASMNRKCAEDLKQQFMDDLKHAEQIDPLTWQDRPVYRKIMETICAPFGYFF